MIQVSWWGTPTFICWGVDAHILIYMKGPIQLQMCKRLVLYEVPWCTLLDCPITMCQCCSDALDNPGSQVAWGTYTEVLHRPLGVSSLTTADGLLVFHPQGCILGSRDVVWGFWHPSNLPAVLGVRILLQMFSSCIWGHRFELTHCSCQCIVAKCCPSCNFVLYIYFKIKYHASVLKCHTIWPPLSDPSSFSHLNRTHVWVDGTSPI